ncbi:hypothetical protein [Paenibacillus xylanexedens]
METFEKENSDYISEILKLAGQKAMLDGDLITALKSNSGIC